MSERLQKKENELSEMTLKLTEMSKIKSQLDEANTNVDALGKTCAFIQCRYKNTMYVA